MTESNARRPVIVGLFVTVALGILGGGILTVGNLRDTFTEKITVSVVFDDVNGLQAGNNIWSAGLKVGNIKALRFQDTARVEVEMLIDEKAAEFIRGDALAKLSSDGLIGNKIVVLYGGTEGAPPLTPGTVLQAGDTVSTEEMLAMLQKNNENILAITADIKTITAQIVAGEGSIGKLVQDDTLYDSLTTTAASLETASASARTLTASLSTFAGKLNQPGSLPNDLVTDKTSYTSLTTSVAQIQEATKSLSGMVAKLDTAASDTTTPVGTLLHDREAGADLKQTLQNLQVGSKVLIEDLEAVQHNFLLRPYFKKKEKEEAKKAKEAAK